MQFFTGLIIKALSGFYYCLTADETETIAEVNANPWKLVECRARGSFRNAEITPLVGDRVSFETEGDGRGFILEILERRNQFTRPPLANLDKLFVVTSIADPVPSLLVLDKLLAVCEYKEIEPVLVITKTDLGDAGPLQELYRTAGFSVVAISDRDGVSEEGLQELRLRVHNGVSAFCGNTGVGKSSLLNRMFPQLRLATGEISQKLGRGRHTTRHVELFGIPGGGMVADTPGFGTMELSQYETIRKEQLSGCFREFIPYVGKCRFMDCSHTTEIGCAVLQAVRDGKIAPSRHADYAALYQESKQIREWELEKPHSKGRK